MRSCGLRSCISGHGPMAGPCEHRIDFQVSRNAGSKRAHVSAYSVQLVGHTDRQVSHLILIRRAKHGACYTCDCLCKHKEHLKSEWVLYSCPPPPPPPPARLCFLWPEMQNNLRTKMWYSEIVSLFISLFIWLTCMLVLIVKYVWLFDWLLRTFDWLSRVCDCLIVMYV
jgi:hypothetical protein